jgi:hypothetical protein
MKRFRESLPIVLGFLLILTGCSGGKSSACKDPLQLDMNIKLAYSPDRVRIIILEQDTSNKQITGRPIAFFVISDPIYTASFQSASFGEEIPGDTELAKKIIAAIKSSFSNELKHMSDFCGEWENGNIIGCQVELGYFPNAAQCPPGLMCLIDSESVSARLEFGYHAARIENVTGFVVIPYTGNNQTDQCYQVILPNGIQSE